MHQNSVIRKLSPPPLSKNRLARTTPWFRSIPELLFFPTELGFYGCGGCRAAIQVCRTTFHVCGMAIHAFGTQIEVHGTEFEVVARTCLLLYHFFHSLLCTIDVPMYTAGEVLFYRRSDGTLVPATVLGPGAQSETVQIENKRNELLVKHPAASILPTSPVPFSDSG